MFQSGTYIRTTPSLGIKRIGHEADTHRVDDVSCPTCFSRSLIVQGVLEDGRMVRSGICTVCLYRWQLDEREDNVAIGAPSAE